MNNIKNVKYKTRQIQDKTTECHAEYNSWMNSQDKLHTEENIIQKSIEECKCQNDQLVKELEELNQSKANLANSKGEVTTYVFKVKHLIKEMRKGIMYTDKDVEALKQQTEERAKRRYKLEQHLEEKVRLKRKIKDTLKRDTSMIKSLI